MKPANFRTRTFTAIIFGVLMIASILAGAVYFALLMLFVYGLGIDEFYKLVAPKASKIARITGTLTGSLIFALIFSINYGWIQAIWFWTIPGLLLFPFLIAMFDKSSYSVSTIGATLAGIVFIAAPLALFASLILLSNKFTGTSGSEFLLMFLAILWLFDSAAYIIGSWIGRHKLYERLSPGKTWEGSVGGLIFGLVAAWVISMFYTAIPLQHWLIIAFIIMVFGTFGDLCESMLKRNAGVKDSGKMLPGHGGILDRFDAVLMSAPAVYLYLLLFMA